MNPLVHAPHNIVVPVQLRQTNCCRHGVTTAIQRYDDENGFYYDCTVCLLLNDADLYVRSHTPAAAPGRYPAAAPPLQPPPAHVLMQEDSIEDGSPNTTAAAPTHPPPPAHLVYREEGSIEDGSPSSRMDTVVV